VAINYLPSEEPDAREVVALIRAAGRKAVPIPGDLRDAGFCRNLVEEAVSQLSGLDILVSNAGRQQSRSSIADVSDEDFDANIYAPGSSRRRCLICSPARQLSRQPRNKPTILRLIFTTTLRPRR
jgi:hypothetical protein